MNILDSNKQKVSLIFNIEATIRTNSITSQNLVISACLDIKFMITYSKFHKCFSVRIFSSNIKIYRWCIAVFKIEVFVNCKGCVSSGQYISSVCDLQNA